MNSKNINKIIILIIWMGLVNSLTTPQISGLQSSENLDLTQVDPKIVINSIILNNNLPEETEEIIATIAIENKDSLNYSNLLIQLTLIPEGSGHDGDSRDNLIVGTRIIQQIGSRELTEVEIFFSSAAGQYTVTAVVIFNNLPILGSQKSVSIQVLTPEVGDNQTLIMAIVVLVLFFFLILFGQAVYDAVKLKNVNLHSKDRK